VDSPRTAGWRVEPSRLPRDGGKGQPAPAGQIPAASATRDKDQRGWTAGPGAAGQPKSQRLSGQAGHSSRRLDTRNRETEN
jgi:hypothetical protein